MCGHCKSHVTTSLSAVEGVSEVNVELEKELATVSFDENTTSLDKIKDALKDSNYEVV